jgi:hypothetical protein
MSSYQEEKDLAKNGMTDNMKPPMPYPFLYFFQKIFGQNYLSYYRKIKKQKIKELMKCLILYPVLIKA